MILFPRVGSWSVSFAMDGRVGVWPLDEEALKGHSFDEESSEFEKDAGRSLTEGVGFDGPRCLHVRFFSNYY